jgi:hypothetical protein
MKRLSSYRSGDRAEEFGVYLMKKFCAVAPVPRQEDFGLFDAVATLLRKDGKLLHAEDSFLVQFKSWSTRKVEYKSSERFNALLNQELALFIVLVNVLRADIKLYSVAAALAHPNINEAKGLVVYLKSAKKKQSGLDEEGILHFYLRYPALYLRMTDLEDPAATEAEKAYTVMKKWLELDRENRRYRLMGRLIRIDRQTNEVPSKDGTSFQWHPDRSEIALTEVVPVVEGLCMVAMHELELAVPMLQILSWMRSRGIDPDPMGLFHLLMRQSIINNQMCEELAVNDRADLAVSFYFVKNEPSSYEFFEYVGALPCSFHGTKHRCSNPDDFRALGFEVEIDPETQKLIKIDLGEGRLAQLKCELLGVSNDVFLLRLLHQA